MLSLADFSVVESPPNHHHLLPLNPMSHAEPERGAPPPASPPARQPHVCVTGATAPDAESVAAAARAAADKVGERRVQRPSRRLAGSFSRDSEVGRAAVLARTSLTVANTPDLVQAGAPQRTTAACTVDPDEHGSSWEQGTRASGDWDKGGRK